MGATQLVWDVMSFTRATGFLQAITDVEPMATIPGPPGTQPGNIQGSDWSITTAAGILHTMTVAAPGPVMVKGNAGWGKGGVQVQEDEWARGNAAHPASSFHPILAQLTACSLS